LTASNIAAWTMAPTLWPTPGAIRGVTNATIFSFQSVITSADAVSSPIHRGAEAAISILTAAE
jgi:hypothetical protein